MKAKQYFTRERKGKLNILLGLKQNICTESMGYLCSNDYSLPSNKNISFLYPFIVPSILIKLLSALLSCSGSELLRKVTTY